MCHWRLVVRAEQAAQEGSSAGQRQYGRNEVMVRTTPTKKRMLAGTVGAPLILPAGALLLGAGLLLERSVNRRGL